MIFWATKQNTKKTTFVNETSLSGFSPTIIICMLKADLRFCSLIWKTIFRISEYQISFVSHATIAFSYLRLKSLQINIYLVWPKNPLPNLRSQWMNDFYLNKGKHFYYKNKYLPTEYFLLKKILHLTQDQFSMHFLSKQNCQLFPQRIINDTQRRSKTSYASIYLYFFLEKFPTYIAGQKNKS